MSLSGVLCSFRKKIYIFSWDERWYGFLFEINTAQICRSLDWLSYEEYLPLLVHSADAGLAQITLQRRRCFIQTVWLRGHTESIFTPSKCHPVVHLWQCISSPLFVMPDNKLIVLPKEECQGNKAISDTICCQQVCVTEGAAISPSLRNVDGLWCWQQSFASKASFWSCRRSVRRCLCHSKVNKQLWGRLRAHMWERLGWLVQ